MSTALYRHFNTDGDLLYIGITDNLMARMNSHHKNAKWFSEIATITVTHYENRETALAEEKSAIRKESPIHNVTHNTRTYTVPHRAYLPTDLTEVIRSYMDDYLDETEANPSRILGPDLLGYLAPKLPEMSTKRLGMELRSAGISAVKSNGQLWYVYPAEYRDPLSPKYRNVRE